MEAILKPEIYVTWIPLGVEVIRPAIYLSFIPKGIAKLRPELMISMIPPAEQQVKFQSDLKRKIGMPGKAVADLSLLIEKRQLLTIDTWRKVYLPGHEINLVGICRNIKKTEQILADTVRLTNGDYIRLCADTSRITATNYAVNKLDCYRELKKTELINCDTVRDFGFSPEGELRTVFAGTVRAIKKTVCKNCNLVCRVPHMLCYTFQDNSWNKRKRSAKTETGLVETFSQYGIQSLSISLNELTLSDRFELQTVIPMEINDCVKGQLFDYLFSFMVEETSQKDLIQTIKGVYDKEKTLYTAINIGVVEASVSYYANSLANALGLKLHRLCDNFTPSQDYSDSGMTYLDFVSSLFGWTSKLPQMQINAFIRGDTLHIIQRGYEENIVDITDWPHPRPTIERKLLRTLWQAGLNDPLNSRAHSSKDDEPIPFTGTIAAGETSRTYANGYLIYEKTKDGYTEYRYDGEYLISKLTQNEDGSKSETNYIYAKTIRDIYLVEEHEKTFDAPDENDESEIKAYKEPDSERVTYHAPVGYGWYSTTVYVDGTLEGSSLSQGKSGGKASRFTINQLNLSLGAHYSIYDDRRNLADYSSLIDTEFPVIGEWYLAQLTKALEWLNRKVQETISIEICSRVVNGIPDIKHIVDFTERIKYLGNEYYLVSNKIEFNSRSFRQKLQIVRWY